jgi:hypothetical protein
MQNVRKWVVLLSATAALWLLAAWHSMDIPHSSGLSGYSLFQDVPTTAQVLHFTKEL